MRQVERCGVTDKQLKPMTYIRDLERELKALLEGLAQATLQLRKAGFGERANER